MTRDRPLMRAFSHALHEFIKEYGGKEPYQVSMTSSTRAALYRELFGDHDGEDMRAALMMDVVIDEALREGDLQFA